MEIENWTDDLFVSSVVFVPPVSTSSSSVTSSSSAVALSAACVSTSSHPHFASSPIDGRMPR